MSLVIFPVPSLNIILVEVLQSNVTSSALLDKFSIAYVNVYDDL
jgi:hypothetical protein